MLPAWNMYELDDVEGKEALAPTNMRVVDRLVENDLRKCFAVGLEYDGRAIDDGAEANERNSAAAVSDTVGS